MIAASGDVDDDDGNIDDNDDNNENDEENRVPQCDNFFCELKGIDI